MPPSKRRKIDVHASSEPIAEASIDLPPIPQPSPHRRPLNTSALSNISQHRRSHVSSTPKHNASDRLRSSDSECGDDVSFQRTTFQTATIKKMRATLRQRHIDPESNEGKQPFISLYCLLINIVHKCLLAFCNYKLFI